MIRFLLHAATVSLLLGLAALAAEAALRAAGRPARGAWLCALAASPLLPALARLTDGLVPVPAQAVVPVLPLVVAGGGTVPSGAGLDAVVRAAWVALSVLLAWRLAAAGRRLRRELRRWPRRSVDGQAVRVSPDLGPAVVGVLRPQIVLPAWALGLSASSRRLALLHEREHAAAGDPRVLAAGLACAVAMPWNLPVWWQLHRLRLAVEQDCDDRVVRRGARPAEYAELLLEVGRRRSAVAPVGALCAAGRPLERRLRRLLGAGKRPARSRTAGLSVLALALATLAMCTPDVTPPPVVDAPPPAAGEAPEEPVAFTPYTEAPRLLNGEAVVRALEQLVAAAGHGGDGSFWLLVEVDGTVRQARVSRTTGDGALDEGVARALRRARFEPARDRGRAVRAWTMVPVVLDADEASVEASARSPAPRLPRRDPRPPAGPPPATGGAVDRKPTFTPYDTPPELSNRAEIGAALRRVYPPLLRDAGIGGTANVWFLVDEAGVVRRTQLQKSSGHGALDHAALRVAEGMAFRPARLNGRPAKVWVALPITFLAGDTPSRRASPAA